MVVLVKEFIFWFKISGLNPFDCELLVKKFTLVRDSFCKGLVLDFSKLDSISNFIIGEYRGDGGKVLELYRIFTNMDFMKSDYEECQYIPSFKCSVCCVDETYGVGVS